MFALNQAYPAQSRQEGALRDTNVISVSVGSALRAGDRWLTQKAVLVLFILIALGFAGSSYMRWV